MNIESTNHQESTNPPLLIASVSGSILINNNKNQNQYMISSKHPLFKNEYIKVSVDDCRLIFSLPTIDYVGKMYKSKVNNKSSEWRYFSITNEFLITGKFEIDAEESSEDELVVYYR
jgi:hypothetical protein